MVMRSCYYFSGGLGAVVVGLGWSRVVIRNEEYFCYSCWCCYCSLM
jgi:hypothetical protein